MGVESSIMVKARINGLDCIMYYDERISADNAPVECPYMYHVRHDEDDWTMPVTLERQVVANFFGTVFMKEPLQMGMDGFLDVDDFEMHGKLTVFKLSGTVLQNVCGLSP